MKIFNEKHLILLQAKNKSLYFYAKQGIDTVFSLCAIMILSPLMLIAAILIKLDSPGSIFYKQERIGLDGKPFFILKFRTMREDAEKDGPQWADDNDARITAVGHYLRKYRIDEIPQFLNILRGEMSLIGPRPERLVFIQDFEKDLPEFRNRLQVKPGITGWAQINGGYDLHPKEKLALDLYYIVHFSLWLDLKIVIKSIPVILLAKGWR
ncbi:exopolysaccharide biosynthesis polyprenyl glycosylphosphotransferase [Bacillus sp. sid0103]|uniref:exopolysaccharide biosynthesis polyprenyl glycosylphosphotransferase n=1 Tax=Bacillus sp. sid0103 TaxID=2856337 RepID=UPI001C440742|nr:exopolysaccharide biosynthesis polyprenyl glycosylphosphotransferase [Bacillus sp. sid0103]MBV7504118.1 exopolysaccharide biosynthesis polyprenyl glycosylphosphotransferase [Bacillus sp. sid0103]